MINSVIMILATMVSHNPSPASLEITVDPRVELVSLVYRLAGHNEYNQPFAKSPYSDSVEEHFSPFRDHPVVADAIRLTEVGVGFDAPMSLAIHLSEEPPFTLQNSDSLDERWPVGEVDAFINELNSFATASGFFSFFERHHALYAAATKSLRDTLSGPGYLAWFDSFFGPRPAARYYVVVAMLNGGACYGPKVEMEDGTEEIYSILGASQFDTAGIPVFGAFYSNLWSTSSPTATQTNSSILMPSSCVRSVALCMNRSENCSGHKGMGTA